MHDPIKMVEGPFNLENVKDLKAGCTNAWIKNLNAEQLYRMPFVLV